MSDAAQAQAEYVEDFQGAVVTFLDFHATHADLAARLAKLVTEHATPVGSGTVARTKRIPVVRCRSRGHCLDATPDDRL